MIARNVVIHMRMKRFKWKTEKFNPQRNWSTYQWQWEENENMNVDDQIKKYGPLNIYDPEN